MFGIVDIFERPVGDETIPTSVLQIGIVDDCIERSSAGHEGLRPSPFT
jgi:hypothetical protein